MRFHCPTSACGSTNGSVIYVSFFFKENFILYVFVVCSTLFFIYMYMSRLCAKLVHA